MQILHPSIKNNYFYTPIQNPYNIMERLKSLRIVAGVLIVLLFIELIALVIMIKPSAAALWMAIGVIAISAGYMARIVFGLINELIDKEK